MRKKFLCIMASISILFGCKQNDSMSWTDLAIERASLQYKDMIASLPADSSYPRSIANGQTTLVNPHDWTSGFFPGSLWYLYALTGEQQWMQQAHQRTLALADIQFDSTTHDLGFMIYCSMGNGLRFAGKEEYKPAMINGARTLISRYNPSVGSIRSWDFGTWQFPVIIDNMMNLEYLYWAWEATNDETFKTVADTHALTTYTHHFRPDFSTWHVLDYDTITGQPITKQTYQGYSDESTWARGQAWAVYGYTLTYRATGDKRFLERAQQCADLFLSHINLPEDKIPYWDFNDPAIPNVPRDASAAAVLASALIELSTYLPDENYFETAESILKTLASDNYLAEHGSNNHFVLKHSTGHMPYNSEVDAPLNYADYYFLEAIYRYRNMKNNTMKF
jgi:unsaturated chondroitin disaccharide hydrolase